MKISLDFILKDLSGAEITEGLNHAGRIVATVLSGQAVKEIEPLKAWEWAQKLWKHEELELDKTDMDKLKSFIEKHEGLSIMAKAQILEILREIK